MKFNIIIPSWNQLELTTRCLVSIKRFSSDYKVVFVDNNSDYEVKKSIKETLKDIPHTLIENNENVGFVKAVNQGILESNAQYYVLMNNDTEAVPGWLNILCNGFSLKPNIGAVGPLTNTPFSWQGKFIPRNTDYLLLEKHRMLAFFCVMMHHKVKEVVGLLDEDFGVGFGDDDDYCHRIHDAGFRLVLAQNLLIPHHHRTTFKELYSDDEIKEMQDTAIQKYKDKHNLT